MPRLSCWLIRAALIYIALGFTVGALLLWNKGIPLHPFLWRLLPLHIEFLFIGWTVQLIMGVAFWVLPRFYMQREKELLVWLAFVLINLGILLVGLAVIGVGPEWLAVFGHSCEVIAVAAFVLHLWPRIKAAGLTKRAAQTNNNTESA